MYEGKKDNKKQQQQQDYSLGLHGAAMNGNVGMFSFQSVVRAYSNKI